MKDGMKKGYIAGGLFSESEIAQRLKEASALRKNVSSVDWFNPIEAPCNDKSNLPTSKDIFKGDTKEILKSDFILADLSHEDAGVMMELGMAWGLQHAYQALVKLGVNLTTEQWFELFEEGIKPKTVACVLSDIRVANAGEYSGNRVPFGYNQFVIGGIEDMGGTVHSSFDTALRIIKEEEYK